MDGAELVDGAAEGIDDGADVEGAALGKELKVGVVEDC